MLINNDINAIKNNMNLATQANAGKKNQLTQDDFMKLLLTQMRMQTPENPFDSNTMMQQMSQLTTLSATKEMEKTVKSLNANLGTSQVLSAAQLVGKKVQVQHESTSLVVGQDVNGSLILPANIDKATVTIRDSMDKVVKVIDLGASPAGMLDFTWNGMDVNNNQMPAGLYKISSTAVIQGESIPVATAGIYNVNSVALDKQGKGVILNLDGVGGVNMDDVIKII